MDGWMDADSHVQTDCIYCSCEDMKEMGESEASATELAVNSLSLIFLKKQPNTENERRSKVTRILTRYICD